MFSHSDRRRQGLAGPFFAGFVVEAIFVVIGGYLLMALWNWFIPPLFEAVPRIGILEAIGIGLVASFMTHQTIPHDDNVDLWEAIIKSIFMRAIRMILFLVMGWIVHSLMV